MYRREVTKLELEATKPLCKWKEEFVSTNSFGLYYWARDHFKPWWLFAAINSRDGTSRIEKGMQLLDIYDM